MAVTSPPTGEHGRTTRDPKKGGGSGGPPPPPPPPAAKPKHTAQRAVYNDYINAHSKLRRYAAEIWNAAVAEGLDPVYFAALLNTEYVPGADGRPKRSSVGAIGVAQIMPSHIGEYAPWLGRNLTAADLNNDRINIRYGAYYFSKALAAHGGDYDAAYRGYGPHDHSIQYNHGYTGTSPFAGLPKSYVASSGYSPQQKAGAKVEEKAAYDELTKGTTFFELWHNQIDPIYEAYTGKRATKKQALEAIKNGWSNYHLQTVLAQTPSFIGSPVWKQNAPGYVSAWRQIYGNQKVDRDAVRYAIIHNLDQGGFGELLRQRNDYVKSNEFRQNVVTMRSVFESIYGTADDNGSNLVKQATLAGWTPDQFNAYLTRLPEYKNSVAWRNSQLNFLDALGLITGQVATLKPSPAPPAGQAGTTTTTIGPGLVYTYPNAAPGVPYDPRAPKAASPGTTGPYYAPTL